jgi:hypothetical protein
LIEESAKLELQAALDTYTALAPNSAGLRIGWCTAACAVTRKRR